jgi:NAD(P)-dependent dehydrogenase (short-subunit alcohol dehydrogenase family)
MNIINQFRMDGRTALITGSSRGIGRAIALAFAECGATVALHATKPSAVVDDTLAEVRKLSPRSIAVFGELSGREVAPRLVAEVIAALGGIDILVANASINQRTAWAEVTQAESEEVMQVNFHASLRLIQAAVPSMQAKKWGRILLVGSVQQRRPHPAMIVYAASKSAQENMARNLAKQLGPDGITVNNLSPGVIVTDRNTVALTDQAYADSLRSAIPLRSFGQPEDCAGTALLLCSDAGRYITGTDFTIDGGLQLP